LSNLFRFVPAVSIPAAVVVSVLSASSVARAQEGQTINEVVVVGVKNTNADVVRLAAGSAGIRETVAFRNDAFTEAKRVIRERGLYETVLGRTETTTDGKLRVIFEVIENPLISNVVITGNKAIKSAELIALVSTKPLTVLNTTLLDTDVQKIQDYYQSKGFLAIVSDQIGVDPNTGILTIPIIETVVESIEVQGLKKTKPIVVTREMRTKVGEPLNVNVLNRDVNRIFNTNLFQDISGVRREPGSDIGKARLIIPVVEQRTGNVGVIFGYSVRQRLTGTLELNETNFRGRGQGLNLSWTLGGVASRSQFEVGFTEPYIDKRGTSLGINLYDRFAFRFNRILSSNATSGQDNDPYFEERQGGGLTLSRPLSEFTRGFISARAENIRANNLSVNYAGLSNDQINNFRGSLIQTGRVASVTFRAANNTRDNEQDPASGQFFSPAVEFGSGTFDYTSPRLNSLYVDEATTPNIPRVFVDNRAQNGAFTKLNLDYRRYISLSGPRRASLREPKRVLALRVLGGVSSGNIGFSEQYFIGGADNLRGYADDRFWGNKLFLASAELRLPFDKGGSLTGVLFGDIGDAWGATTANREDIQGFQQRSTFRPNLGFGFGVRVKTPVGPVRLDYGIGETNRTHFSIGQAF